MMNYLKLIRWPNLLITAFIFVAFRYGFMIPLNMQTALSTVDFILLVVSILSIMAGGYIINDIQDYEIDKVNKPKKVFVNQTIKEGTASNLMIGSFGLGLGLGYYLGWKIGYTSFASVHLVLVALLWVYSNYFKGKPLIGNVIIAFLSAVTILILPIFDFIPVMKAEEWDIDQGFLIVFLGYSIFSFTVTMMREIVKDLQDEEGDRTAKLRTMPIAWGTKISKGLFTLFALLTLIGLIFFLKQSQGQTYVWIYTIATLVVPVLTSILLIYKGKKPKDYKFISSLIKAIMVFGILSVVYFTWLVYQSIG